MSIDAIVDYITIKQCDWFALGTEGLEQIVRANPDVHLNLRISAIDIEEAVSWL